MSDDDTQDDKALFREAMRAVKPLKPNNKTWLKQARKVVGRKQLPVTEQQDHMFSTAAVEDCPSQLSFARPGIQHTVMKQLHQGKMAVEARLDLHGMVAEQARSALIAFLQECDISNVRCALIVHGKGYRSPGNRPVIKPLINRWLQQSPQVLAFASAQPKDGGNGAVYVLLKRNV